MPQGQALVPVEDIARRIHTVRGQRVILDSDLARLYGVTTKRLNQQVIQTIRGLLEPPAPPRKRSGFHQG